MTGRIRGNHRASFILEFHGRPRDPEFPPAGAQATIVRGRVLETGKMPRIDRGILLGLAEAAGGR